MANYSQNKFSEFIQQSNGARTSVEKGKALEDFICYVFEKVPGITVSKRNQLNTSLTEEIDIAFWNDQKPNGFRFLHHIILVECKNWSNPVGTDEVSFFIQKVQHRRLPYGILIAANGITGSSIEVNRAHQQISLALSSGHSIIVLTLEEIMELKTTNDLIQLFKEKLCELAVSGTIF
jgi:hypothetical protein